MHIRFCALFRALTLVAVGVAAFVFASGASAVDPASAPAVQLTSPNEPETWYVGDYCTASADVIDDDGVGYVEFRLSTDDGATFPILLGGANGATSVECIVPEVDTTNARVMVIASDALGNTASDVSDNAFTITARPVAVDWLELTPTRVVGGTSAQATVTLTGAAPAGGAAVALASSNRSVAAVPTSVTVPEGQTDAVFSVSTTEVAATTSVRITASYGGYPVTSTLTVAAPAGVTPRVASLSLNPMVVVAGRPSKATVTLTDAAPEGGAVVALSSSDPTVATVDESVVVPADETSTTFAVSSIFGSPSATVTISASYGGASVSAPLTVTPSAVARISIQRADYAISQGKLRVTARSASETETLSVYVTSTGELIGRLKSVGGGDYQGKFNWPANPIEITVISSTGATGTTRVRAR